ncbi:MAG TPA: polysaccharide deacetylase family protein [Thermoanaerobaculia bacterium]|jgi:peptidoglycan/xylan/chitin deacetylase (PgdA/CDA1 family)|nr:polysaccharide deacetylase family protein [Thermoanaerobaculia bacterium]
MRRENRALQGIPIALLRFVRLAPIAALSLVLTTAALAQNTTILAYHEVDPLPERGWAVSSEDFAEQMRYLAITGYNVIPIAALADYVNGKRSSLPPNSVVITSDDGWLCNYTVMAPILKRLGFPWSLYVYPKIVGEGSHALTWSQIEQLSGDGVDIESHTLSHADLLRKSHREMTDADYDKFLNSELEESRRIIESHIGHPVRFIAYPYGNYDNSVTAAARRAGYVAGLVSWMRPNTRTTDPMKLGRVKMVSSMSLEDFRSALGAAALQWHDLLPANEGVLASGQLTLSASLDDPQLDPASIRATLLSGTPVDTAYDAASHRLTLTLATKPREERQRVVVQATNAQGVRTIGIWTFFMSSTAQGRYAELKSKMAKLPMQDAATPQP